MGEEASTFPEGNDGNVLVTGGRQSDAGRDSGIVLSMKGDVPATLKGSS